LTQIILVKYYKIGPGTYENIDASKSFISFQKKYNSPPKFPKEKRFFEKLRVVK
jgi:hypothetical protein